MFPKIEALSHARRGIPSSRRRSARASATALLALLIAASACPPPLAAQAPRSLPADHQLAIAQGAYDASQLQINSDFLASSAENLKTMADWGTVLSNLRDLKLPDNPSPATIGFFNRIKPYQAYLGAAGTDSPALHDFLLSAYAVADAIKQDLARPPGNPILTALSSNTLEQIQKFEFEWITSAKTLKALTDAGKISEPFAKYAGFLSFGAEDLAIWAGQGTGTGKWSDPEVLSHLLDGINRGAWAAVGFLASGGNREVAEAFSGAAGFIAPFVRDHTVDFFADQFMRWGGVNQTIIDQYTQAQQAHMARQQPVQSFEQFVGFNPAILQSVGRNAIANADARFGVRPPPDQMPESVVTRTTSESYREVCRSGFCTRTNFAPEQPREGGVRINPKPGTGRPAFGWFRCRGA